MMMSTGATNAGRMVASAAAAFRLCTYRSSTSLSNVAPRMNRRQVFVQSVSVLATSVDRHRRHRHCNLRAATAAAAATRFYGSMRDGEDGEDDGPAVFASDDAGEIFIEDDQTALPNLDLDRIRDTISRIRTAIGYPNYGVSLLLVEDDEMKETNHETRGVNSPTDILSFPFHPAIEPGVLVEPEFDIPDYYNLGDMMVDVPYVIRRCQEDLEDCSSRHSDNNEDKGEEAMTKDKDDTADDEECEEDERGVSAAMSTVYDVEDRINMLLVHGMLHLVGHDHEDDDEYELMVSEEERLLKELGFSSFKGEQETSE